MSTDTPLSTARAVEAVAWGRAPRYKKRTVNRRVVCADGFKVSVQASAMHYANDSHPSGEPAYWRMDDVEPAYPFTTFEVGNPSGPLEPADVWEDDNGGHLAMDAARGGRRAARCAWRCRGVGGALMSEPCGCDDCRTGSDQWCCSTCHDLARWTTG